jgi:spermidine synthase
MWENRVEEMITPHECHVHEVIEVLASGRTARQGFEIVQLGGYGRAMVIEGRVQSTEADEAAYHESLIFPGYCLLPHTRRVLCLGGANGGVLHRLCALPDLREVVQLDVDAELHQRSVELLPHMHRGAQADQRCRLEFGDPTTLLASQGYGFDLVLADLPDAVEGSPTTALFTREFYGQVRDKLAPHGVFATQAGSANPLDIEFFASVLRTLRSVFRYALPYTMTVPSYGIPWGFVLASDALNPTGLTEAQVDRKLAAVAVSPEWYDGMTHRHMTALPLRLRTALTSAGRLISAANTLAVRI